MKIAGEGGYPLCLLGSADGAGRFARAAVDALIGVDDVHITLGNRVNGATGRASAASDASIFINLISHFKILLIFF